MIFLALKQVESLFEKLFKEVKLCPIKLVEEKVTWTHFINDPLLFMLSVAVNLLIIFYSQRKKAEKDRKQQQRDV